MLTNESMHDNRIQIKGEKEYAAGEGRSNMRHFQEVYIWCQLISFLK